MSDEKMEKLTAVVLVVLACAFIICAVSGCVFCVASLVWWLR